MGNINEYFQETSDTFTVFVVEQRFVVGQGNEYFKSYRGTANFISTEEAIKKNINKVLLWTQQHIPNIAEIAVYGAQRSPFRFRTAAFRSKTAAHI